MMNNEKCNISCKQCSSNVYNQLMTPKVYLQLALLGETRPCGGALEAFVGKRVD